jgi:hypothetical protein
VISPLGRLVAMCNAAELYDHGVTTEHYWSIDFPGLTAMDARRICDLVGHSGLAYDAIPVDPGSFLTLHMDRSTVELLVAALAGAQADAGVQSMVEVLGEWLGGSA